MPEHEDDLIASKTEGFKVGEKKTINEYTELGMWISPSILESRISLCTNLPRGITPYRYARTGAIELPRFHSSCHPS